MIKAGIYIPTKSRNKFIKRQLLFYKELNSIHSVYIGDSSSLEEFNYLNNFIKSENFSFNIFHYHIPGVSAELAHINLVKNIKEKYCAFCGDDDFLIPLSISKAINILEENPDVRISQGKSVIIETLNSEVYGEVIDISDYLNYTNCEYSTARERIEWFSKNYFTLQFSLHRTDEYLLDMKNIEKIRDRNFTELLTGFSCIANGKSILFDDLYLIRQNHIRRNLMPSKIDWITSKYWLSSYRIFIRTLLYFVLKNDSITKKEALIFVKEILHSYLFRSISKKNNPKTIKLLIYNFINIKFYDILPIRSIIKKYIFNRKYKKYGNILLQTIQFIERQR